MEFSWDFGGIFMEFYGTLMGCWANMVQFCQLFWRCTWGLEVPMEQEPWRVEVNVGIDFATTMQLMPTPGTREPRWENKVESCSTSFCRDRNGSGERLFMHPETKDVKRSYLSLKISKNPLPLSWSVGGFCSHSFWSWFEETTPSKRHWGCGWWRNHHYLHRNCYPKP